MEALPWYIAGPLLGSIVPALLIVKEKQLGVSSSFRVLGAMLLPRLDYFKYNWRKDLWQIHFALGLVLAAFVLFAFTEIGTPIIDISKAYGVLSVDVYNPSNALLFFIGATCIGFGARYANGCTAGHCIMGNAQLATSSMLTTVFFFIGGLIATYCIIPNSFIV